MKNEKEASAEQAREIFFSISVFPTRPPRGHVPPHPDCTPSHRAKKKKKKKNVGRRFPSPRSSAAARGRRYAREPRHPERPPPRCCSSARPRNGRRTPAQLPSGGPRSRSSPPRATPPSMSASAAATDGNSQMLQQQHPRSKEAGCRQRLTVVFKLGSSSICHEVTHRPLLSNLSLVVEAIVELRELGHRVALVSSGAIATGLRRLNIPARPKTLAQVQVRKLTGSVWVGCSCEDEVVEENENGWSGPRAKPALAAVGQGRLMSLYDDLFEQFNTPIAQVLLTKNDLADRTQYFNAVNTLNELLALGVVPIINENDTICAGVGSLS
ncbi:MAG: Aspartate/glutamate/uridylate kinase [Olpidium bornovanus]|uniref:Aspartate/glutamate/uridylate kinase n=1 Tax=Olpidium bornovanus TaxID=278681 RepID=A0A8H7ZNV5_9FUNG|nr:MAG: Aspartate/glutamate/uridylate kinase [Olpidium bornovanus]